MHGKWMNSSLAMHGSYFLLACFRIKILKMILIFFLKLCLLFAFKFPVLFFVKEDVFSCLQKIILFSLQCFRHGYDCLPGECIALSFFFSLTLPSFPVFSPR